MADHEGPKLDRLGFLERRANNRYRLKVDKTFQRLRREAPAAALPTRIRQ